MDVAEQSMVYQVATVRTYRPSTDESENEIYPDTRLSLPLASRPHV